MIEVLPSRNEDYRPDAEEILRQIQDGAVKGKDGEGLVMSIVDKNGNVKMAGFGDKAQIISVAFNLIMQVAGINPNAHETRTEEAPLEH